MANIAMILEQITSTIEYLRDFNFVSILVRLLLAAILSGLIGMERSKSGRAAGLRTHMLVCLGAAVASLTGLYINQMVGGDASRIAAQVISGIGFLGSACILIRNHVTITGLTTAACIWAVGAIGIAIGYGFYEVAIIATILILFINNILNRVDKKIRHNMKDVAIYIEFVNVKKLNSTFDGIRGINAEIDMVDLMQSKTNLPEGIGAEMVLQVRKDLDVNDLIGKINDIDNVHFAILTNH